MRSLDYKKEKGPKIYPTVTRQGKEQILSPDDRLNRPQGDVPEKVSKSFWRVILKGKGERHFFEDGKQWTGETHKHPDGTLMSGKEHVEGTSKKLFHLYELSEKVLRHLSKETTEIK